MSVPSCVPCVSPDRLRLEVGNFCACPVLSSGAGDRGKVGLLSGSFKGCSSLRANSHLSGVQARIHSSDLSPALFLCLRYFVLTPRKVLVGNGPSAAAGVVNALMLVRAGPRFGMAWDTGMPSRSARRGCGQTFMSLAISAALLPHIMAFSTIILPTPSCRAPSVPPYHHVLWRAVQGSPGE